ncbi:hypothetical protein TrVE_jg12688 [Triparma verrucosa]|uniref:Uncharacterized protein n=1 Tax=Triparma verrucosa TaxID=1606542 RepID=A0A9W7C4I9_9STRA|nr:hypothetical protein TrVE_jg12688 [Triparma verrucosa]
MFIQISTRSGEKNWCQVYLREEVEAVTLECGNSKTYEVVSKMFLDSYNKSNIEVNVRTLKELKSLQDVDADEGKHEKPPEDAEVEDDDDDVIFLMLTYTTSYDSVHYPFGVQKVDSEYSPETEIVRLRSVVQDLESRLSSSFPPSSPPRSNTTHNLSSPTRSSHNSLTSAHALIKRQYTELKSSSSKRITRLERQLRALTYTEGSSDKRENGRLKLKVRELQEEASRERRGREKAEERAKDALRKLTTERRASRGRERDTVGRSDSRTPKGRVRSVRGTSAGASPRLAPRSAPRSSVVSRYASPVNQRPSTAPRPRSQSPRVPPSRSRSSASRVASGSTQSRVEKSRTRSSPRPPSPRFDPTAYVKNKKSKEKENLKTKKAWGGYDSDSSGSLIIPRVTRSTKTSKKQPNRNTSSSHLHSPHMKRSPSTSKSKPSKFSPKVRVRKMVRDKLSKDDDIFNDIEDIDKRLIALQGFLKDAKESR